MAEWTYKLDIDMLERKGTSACLDATRAMIARIRELEAELERASQPGSGEARYSDELAKALGMGVGTIGGKRVGFAWQYLIGIVEDMVSYYEREEASASLDGRREG